MIGRIWRVARYAEISLRVRPFDWRWVAAGGNDRWAIHGTLCVGPVEITAEAVK